MSILYYILFIVFILSIDNSIQEDDILKLNNELRQKLSEEQKNAECCNKKLRCCKQRLDPPNIEIRAILARCPRGSSNDDPNFDEDETLSNSGVNKCNKKLLVTMKIKNAGPTNCKNVFVVVDHVYDPVTSTTARLLNPYVIKIKQEPITALYKLHFQHVVNSEAREVVYNKHKSNYTGCDTTSSRPTCGVVKYNGKVVPYSTGFCCSCDALVNSKRQPGSATFFTALNSNSDALNTVTSVQCPRHLRATEDNEDEKTIDNLSHVLERKTEGVNVKLNDEITEKKSSQNEPFNIEGVFLGNPNNENVFIREIKDDTKPTGEKLKQKVDELQKLLNDQLELDSQVVENELSKYCKL